MPTSPVVGKKAVLVTCSDHRINPLISQIQGLFGLTEEPHPFRLPGLVVDFALGVPLVWDRLGLMLGLGYEAAIFLGHETCKRCIHEGISPALHREMIVQAANDARRRYANKAILAGWIQHTGGLCIPELASSEGIYVPFEQFRAAA